MAAEGERGGKYRNSMAAEGERGEKYRNSMAEEGESISPMTKASKIF
jgi:hypothetical protein